MVEKHVIAFGPQNATEVSKILGQDRRTVKRAYGCRSIYMSKPYRIYQLDDGRVVHEIEEYYTELWIYPNLEAFNEWADGYNHDTPDPETGRIVLTPRPS
jgi:hypothetical protein